MIWLIPYTLVVAVLTIAVERALRQWRRAHRRDQETTVFLAFCRAHALGPDPTVEAVMRAMRW